MTDRALVCVYTTHEIDRTEIALLEGELESRGIEVVRRGGDDFPPEWPQLGADGPVGALFVPTDQADEARREIQAWLAARARSRPRGESWTCSDCGEENGPAFERCWRCGEART